MWMLHQELNVLFQAEAQHPHGRRVSLADISEQVQFIYITHNKLAMTMATDLLGVTMPEPGTSKLVTVNLEEAAEYGLVAEA